MAPFGPIQEAEIRRKLFEEVELAVKRSTANRRKLRWSEVRQEDIARERCHAATLLESASLKALEELANQSPLSTPRSRRQVLSNTRSASFANIGWEGAALLTPSKNTQSACRFHDLHQAPGSPRRPPAVQQASMAVKEECRFHCESFHRRRAPQEPIPLVSGVSVPVAAGVVSARCRRYDTPPSVAMSISRTRSSTPDYHLRYSTNLSGTSLPGAPDAPSAPTSPSGLMRTPSCSPLHGPPIVLSPGARASEEAVRFHHEEVHKNKRHGPGPQAFTLSSSSSELLASPRPHRQGKPWR